MIKLFFFYMVCLRINRKTGANLKAFWLHTWTCKVIVTITQINFFVLFIFCIFFRGNKDDCFCWPVLPLRLVFFVAVVCFSILRTF